MEESTVKTQIFETETVLNQTAEQPIDADFTLPEYYPDVEKILKCCCDVFITQKGINGSNGVVEGSADITVIYLGSDNMLNSYEYKYPFSKTFDIPSISSEFCFTANAETEYINCRAVSPRKIDLHGAVNINVLLTERVIKEFVSDTLCGETETKRKEFITTVPLSCSEKYLNIEEEIEIGNNSKEINCVIRYDGNPHINDGKLMAGKASIRGEFAVNLLYCDNEGNIIGIKENFPFAQMLEIENSAENCKCDIFSKLCALEIKPKSNAEGEVRSFSVNAKILVSVKTFCEQTVCAVLDAYSRKCETEISYIDVEFKRIIGNINENFTLKQKLDFETTEIAGVYDIWSKKEIENSSAKDGQLSVFGKMTVYILAYDQNQIPVFFERQFPFELKKDIPKSCEQLYVNPETAVKNTGFTLLSSGEIEIRTELSLSAAIFESIKQKVISEIKLNKENPIGNKKDYATVLYYAESGETVWDIAAKYLADVEEIKKINGIEEDVLQSGKMLLVPLG